MYFLVYRKRQRKARLEAASTLNANAAAMTSTNLRNEPNNLPPGYYYSNYNNSAIIVMNNPPLPVYDDVMMTSTPKLTKDAPPTYEDATYIVNN